MPTLEISAPRNRSWRPPIDADVLRSSPRWTTTRSRKRTGLTFTTFAEFTSSTVTNGPFAVK